MKLEGAKAISNYLDLSESTIMDLILKNGLPAEQTKDSIWVSDSDKIDEWRGMVKKEPVAKLTATAKAKTSVKADAEADAEGSFKKGKDGKYSKK